MSGTLSTRSSNNASRHHCSSSHNVPSSWRAVWTSLHFSLSLSLSLNLNLNLNLNLSPSCWMQHDIRIPAFLKCSLVCLQ